MRPTILKISRSGVLLPVLFQEEDDYHVCCHRFVHLKSMPRHFQKGQLGHCQSDSQSHPPLQIFVHWSNKLSVAVEQASLVIYLSEEM